MREGHSPCDGAPPVFNVLTMGDDLGNCARLGRLAEDGIRTAVEVP
jgi:hypothetical protein